MKITDSVIYAGVNDHRIDMFEGQYAVPNGIAYNSYVILDEKAAVMDTADARFAGEWLGNVKKALGGRKPDYLIVQHMEPDHSANIDVFLSAYPEAKIAASAKAFAMMKGFFGTDYPDRRIVVGEGDTLSLGGRTLTFAAAPMVHWPEVIMTYDDGDRILFSADAFGKFGALDVEEGWADEARRYYIGIVGKYGAQVQAALKKAAAFDIERICPLHGPVLTGNLGYYLDLYNTWSSYGAESGGVAIAYTSVYGNTKRAAGLLAEKLRARGCADVAVYDVARCDWAQAVADAFRCGKLVLATTTYNAGIFPAMRSFIEHLTERGYQKRTVAFIENGSWAPAAARIMRGMLEKSKDITFADTVATVRSALDSESGRQLEMLADELCRSGAAQPQKSAPDDAPAAADGPKKSWVCKICGWVYEGEELPADIVCPICRRGAADFEEMK